MGQDASTEGKCFLPFFLKDQKEGGGELAQGRGVETSRQGGHLLEVQRLEVEALEGGGGKERGKLRVSHGFFLTQGKMKSCWSLEPCQAYSQCSRSNC